MSSLIVCKPLMSLGVLVYDISPTVNITTDNFGAEASPSIDCHKCPSTSFEAAGGRAAWIPMTV